MTANTLTGNDIDSDAIAFRAVDNARVQAWRLIVGAPDAAFAGGPVLDAPEDARLRHCHSGQPADRFDPSIDFEHAERLAGTWNYLGPVYPHFGHVMAEMVHRVLPAREIFQHDQWLAVAGLGTPTTDFDDLPASYREALEVLGIGRHNLVIIHRDTVVERLNIAEQGTHLGIAPSPSYLQTLADYSTRLLDEKFEDIARPRRVYVTRSGIPDSGNFLGESCLESWLAAEGFEIFKPEQHPLIVQMDVYRKAEVLVFSEGSACHGTELLGSDMLDQAYLLLRRSSHQHIWHDVLKTRAYRYADAVVSVPLGSCVCHPSSPTPLPNFEQFVFDLEALAQWFRSIGLAELDTLDKTEYFDRAKEDLERHIESVRAAGHSIAPLATIEAMRQALAEARAQQLGLVSSGDLETDPTIIVQLAEAPTETDTDPSPREPIEAVETVVPTGAIVAEPIAEPHEDENIPDLDGPDYRSILERLHASLTPRRYLEIGVSNGDSLALASGIAIGIDPDLSAARHWSRGKTACLMFQMTSDDFFAQYSATQLAGGPIDLAFLDGLHYFEFLLRDFINTEKVCAPGSTIVLHDCVPTDAGVAERANDPALRPRHPDWWAGDVWKLLPILRRHRPDLRIDVLDAAPTGLVVIRKLDPTSRVLEARYDAIDAEWRPVTLARYGVMNFLSQAGLRSAAQFDPRA